IVGAMSHVDAVALFSAAGELRYDRPLRDDVRVFEGGMLSSVSCRALSASLELLLELGPHAIFAHVDEYLQRLESELVARGFRSLRMAAAGARSGILGVVPPPGLLASQLVVRLAEHGVVCSSPDGVLRFAPHFHNALEQVPEVVRALDRVLGR